MREPLWRTRTIGTDRTKPDTCGMSQYPAGLHVASENHARPVATAEVATAESSLPTRASLNFDGLRIDKGVREVVVDEKVVPLTRLEFDLLAHLASRPRQVFSRGELLSQVWHSSPDWQTSKTVTEHVRRIRHKIEPSMDSPRWIRTVPGAGYRFEP